MNSNHNFWSPLLLEHTITICSNKHLKFSSILPCSELDFIHLDKFPKLKLYTTHHSANFKAYSQTFPNTANTRRWNVQAWVLSLGPMVIFPNCVCSLLKGATENKIWRWIVSVGFWASLNTSDLVNNNTLFSLWLLYLFYLLYTCINTHTYMYNTQIPIL